MSNKNEPGMAYDTKKLNKVFAFLSILFLITTFWVFLDDYMRPWKAVQVEAMKIKKQKLEEKLAAAQQEIDEKKLEELEQQMVDAEKLVKTRRDSIAAAEKEKLVIARDLKAETILNGQLSAKVSEAGFQSGEALMHHSPKTEAKYNKLHALKADFAASKDRLKALQVAEKAINKKIAGYKKEITDIEKEIKSLNQTRDLVKLSLSKTKITPLFVLRNLPFIDFLDPTLKIEQIVVPQVTDDRYFQHVPKVDRCITCHTFINEPGYEDQPNPHRTHPNLDLMVGADSPHPMKKWGCTACHGGEGHRVNDFNSAAHTPKDEEQKKEWIAKYNWHPPHKIPQVMYKQGMAEASCIKCHKGVEYIPQGTIVNDGIKHIERFGCYGCHKIEGWEHKRRPGPSLKKITAKISKDFFKSWVWDPKSFNKHANMPSFFRQSNNSAPEFQSKNVVEVNAMADFIWSKSKDYKPFEKYAGGDVEAGKELIKEVGCMGCHGVEGWDNESKKVQNHAGPYLTGTGSKVDKDWLVSWLLKPSHYQEDTIMPSFRLSKKEANDIAAYLMSLRNKKFEQLKFNPLDKKLRDEILIGYFTAFDTMDAAKAKLAKMTDHERTLELGYRSVGKYGCYSCHAIDGFEGRAPIGPELSKIGSKPLTQFGFNLKHDVEHSRDGWITAHLLDPRRWDEGMDKDFNDLTRMPNFYMTKKQAHEITVALVGMVGDKIPADGVKRLNAQEKIAAEGMKIVNKYNCTGCHQIDGEHGNILAMYDDINEGPPRLVDQGHRVQADWFHQFLNHVYPIRPWLKVRMPSFNLTNEERNLIVSGFQAKAKQDTFEENYSEITWEKGEREAAEYIWKEGAACIACHTHKWAPDEEPSAPNLFYAKRKLRPSWIKKWLYNPQAIMPGTLMGNFFQEEGEVLMPDVLDGDIDRQIEAVTKYLLEMGYDGYGPTHPTMGSAHKFLRGRKTSSN